MINKTGSISTAVSLHFAPGHRPDAADVSRVASLPAENTTFSVSHRPKADEGWLEILAMGLTYDISGLAPGVPAASAHVEHLFGLDASVLDPPAEALRLVPGPHLVAGSTLLPVVRILAGLGAELARLPGLLAIGWEPARSLMAPAYFMSSVRAWLSGGVFPSLGLTALSRGDDNVMQSEGLKLFTGFEILLEPIAGEKAQDAAKLASRVINQIVQAGVAEVSSIQDAQGRQLTVEFTAERSQLRVWRKG